MKWPGEPRLARQVAWTRAGKRLEQRIRWREGIQVRHGPQRRRIGKPVAGMSSSIFWRGDMLVWALARQGVSRALLTGGAAQRDLVEIVGPLQEGDRFFALAALRFVRGRT